METFFHSPLCVFHCVIDIEWLQFTLSIYLQILIKIPLGIYAWNISRCKINYLYINTPGALFKHVASLKKYFFFLSQYMYVSPLCLVYFVGDVLHSDTIVIMTDFLLFFLINENINISRIYTILINVIT